MKCKEFVVEEINSAGPWWCHQTCPDACSCYALRLGYVQVQCELMLGGAGLLDSSAVILG
jgi:hypothetical protein